MVDVSKIKKFDEVAFPKVSSIVRSKAELIEDTIRESIPKAIEAAENTLHKDAKSAEELTGRVMTEYPTIKPEIKDILLFFR